MTPVAQVLEVVGLGAARHLRLLGLDEVADVHLFAEVASGAQVREGADLGPAADARVDRHRVGLHDGVLAHRHVREDAADVDRGPPADARGPPQDRTGLDDRIGLERDGRVDARTIAHRDSGEPPAPDEPRMHEPLDRRELLAIVDAGERVGAQLDRGDLPRRRCWRIATMSVR